MTRKNLPLYRVNGSYLVHGLDTDIARVIKIRAGLEKKGSSGPVSVALFDGKNLPYVDNLVNLIVSSGKYPSSAKAAAGKRVSEEEILRVLAPRGVAIIDGKKTVKPVPPEIDEWTHYLHGADNNAVARDTVVGPPKRYQWVSGPVWARSHDHLSSLSALVSARGRIFYIIDEAPTASVAIPPRWFLVARDAFSGVLLWKLPVSPWEGHLRGFRTGPTELARRLVAVGDRVYVTLGYGKCVSALDAATGETVKTYEQTKNAMELVCRDRVMYVVVGDRVPDNTEGKAVATRRTGTWMHWPIWQDIPPKKHLVAVNTNTGKTLWTKRNDDTFAMMPTTLAAAGKMIYLHTGRDILALDASTGKELWRAARPVSLNRPTWSAPTLTVSGDVLLCGDRDAVTKSKDGAAQWSVNSHGGLAPVGKITAFNAGTGKPLWESSCKEIYNSPVDVLVADGLVWSGIMVRSKEPGITRGLDLKTGKPARKRPADQKFFPIVMGHHRCYRNKATEKYLVLGRDGTEYIDVKTGKGFGNAWVRGACQYGVMPCNGLTYNPPHSCACHVEKLLNSFNALSAREPVKRAKEGDRFEKGPAYGQTENRKSKVEDSSDWSTYRHDPARSGATGNSIPAEIKELWASDLGTAGTQCVLADGILVTATPETHSVHGLDPDSGRKLWTFTAGGRVDSPPTLYNGMAVFGCADGWIYCMRAKDGVLAWRFCASPSDQRIVAYGRVESPHPVHGSVLIDEGVVYAAAGRTAYLDGGIYLHRIDLATGKQLSEAIVTKEALPDVLASDGTSIFMRGRRMSKTFGAQKATVPHLYSPAGFLDGSWWHRTYWQVGTSMGSNYAGWPRTGGQVPSGRLLVKDGKNVYGFGRFNQYNKIGSHVGLGKMKYMLYAASLSPRKAAESVKQPAPKRRRKGRRPQGNTGASTTWSQSIPLLARGMVLSAGRTLFVVGPPDVFGTAPAGKAHPYDPAPEKGLLEQEKALKGERGGLLMAIEADTGKVLSECKLDSSPSWDGLSAADGKLYLSTLDGKVRCFGDR